MTDRMTILLVEDNPGDARLVREAIGTADGRAERTWHGSDDVGEVVLYHEETLASGLDRLASADVDVVLLDLGLPESRGIETLERTQERDEDVPIVVLTGQPEAELGVDAVARGAQEYLVKDDVTPDVLALAIEYAIERKRSERALRRRTEELAILNHLTRHDIRNDVSLVVGRARELSDVVDPRHERLVDEILNSANHVLQLTRTVGDIVESMTGARGSELGPIDLGRVLESEVDTARSLYRGAVVTVSEPSEDVQVHANDLLSSVFANLLGNAILYNDKERPEVEVWTAVGDETATVHVADNGPGIPSYHREQLFRAPDGAIESGTSVGLYLVGRLVDQYGGDVRVENREEGGAVFSVTLQLA